MKLRAPPRIKILEALSAIADDRVKLVGQNDAVVTSSDGTRKYEVNWDPSSNKVSSTDNGTTHRNYVGYPIIALLMLHGVLPYDASLSKKLEGINWRRLNEKYKQYEVVIDNVLRAWRVPDRDRLWKFTRWINSMLSDLELEKEEPKTTLSDFVEV